MIGTDGGAGGDGLGGRLGEGCGGCGMDGLSGLGEVAGGESDVSSRPIRKPPAIAKPALTTRIAQAPRSI